MAPTDAFLDEANAFEVDEETRAVRHVDGAAVAVRLHVVGDDPGGEARRAIAVDLNEGGRRVDRAREREVRGGSIEGDGDGPVCVRAS